MTIDEIFLVLILQCCSLASVRPIRQSESWTIHMNIHCSDDAFDGRQCFILNSFEYSECRQQEQPFIPHLEMTNDSWDNRWAFGIHRAIVLRRKCSILVAIDQHGRLFGNCCHGMYDAAGNLENHSHIYIIYTFSTSRRSFYVHPQIGHVKRVVRDDDRSSVEFFPRRQPGELFPVQPERNLSKSFRKSRWGNRWTLHVRLTVSSVVQRHVGPVEVFPTSTLTVASDRIDVAME